MGYPSGAVMLPPSSYQAAADQDIFPLDSFTGTDDQKMTSALAAAVAAGGGTIQASARTYTFYDQITTAYDAAVMTPIRIAGAGGTDSIDSQTPQTGAVTTFLLAYSGAIARMNFNHLGLIEIDHVQLEDSGGSATPFFFTYWSTPRLHDNTWTGSATGTSCFQDAIILGGTDNSHGFQGYGGNLHDNHFSGIRRAVTLQFAANAIVIRENMISADCGDPARLGAPFVIAGGSSLTVNGAHIVDNLIEMDGYGAAVNAIGGYAQYCLIGPNTLWDSSTGCVYLAIDGTCANNIVDDRVYAAYTDPPIYGTGPNTTNILSRGNNPTCYSTPQYYYNDLRARGFSLVSEDSFGNGAYLQPYSTATNPYIPGTQLVARAGKIVTDGNIVSGSKYVTSATAAFSSSTDTGAPFRSFNSTGIIAGYIERVYGPASWLIAWSASQAAALGDLAVPTTSNGHMYQCTTAGTTGATQPTWPTGGGTVTDGTVVWTDLGTGKTAIRCSAAATVSGTGANLFWSRIGGTNIAMTTFYNHHILGSGVTPTWTPNANAGSGATCTVAGKDLGHVLTLTTGTGPASGIQATGAAGQTLSAISGACVIQPSNAAAAALMSTSGNGVYIAAAVGGLSTAWTLTSAIALSASTVYEFSVVTIG